MATTVRDVVMRVSVEAGKLSLGNLDMSAAKKQLESDLSGMLAGVTGTISSSRSSSGLSGSSGGSSVDLRKTLKNIDEWFSQPATLSSIPMGHRGYAQSVRNRSKSNASEDMTFASQAGLTAGYEQKDLDRLQQMLEKKHQMIIRENDRENAASEAFQSKQENKKAQQQHQILQGVRGLALMAAGTGGNGDSQKMVQQVLQVEGAYKALSSVVVALGPEVAALAGPFALAGAAMLASGVAAHTVYAHYRQLEAAKFQFQTASAAQQGGFEFESISGSVNRRLYKAANLPSSLHARQGADRAENRGLWESYIREKQVGHDFTTRQEIRGRAESDLSLRESAINTQNAIKDVDRQRRVRNIDGLRTQITESKASMGKRHEQALAGIAAETKHGRTLDLDEIAFGSVSRSLKTHAPMISSGLDAAGVSKFRDERFRKQQEQKVNEENNRYSTEKAGLSKTETESEQADNQSLKEKGELLQQELATRREIVKQSRLRAESDEESTKSTMRNIGSMNPAQRVRLKNIQAKLLNGQHVTHREASELAGLGPEVKGFDLAQKALEGFGADGPELRHREVESKKEADEAEKTQTPLVNDLVKKTKENAELQSGSEDKVLDSLNNFVKFSEIATAIDQKFRQFRIEFEAWKVQNQGWLG